jgi:SAM-dependent methyltransferase
MTAKQRRKQQMARRSVYANGSAFPAAYTRFPDTSLLPGEFRFPSWRQESSDQRRDTWRFDCTGETHMRVTENGGVQTHNERAAAVWSAGGQDYDEISRGIADAIEHCVLRLNPQPGEQILDLSTGTGWTSRVVARRGGIVTGVDIAADLLSAARTRAEVERLRIDYQLGDAECLPFEDGKFDAVISTFGVMFASRPETASAEIARVCRRGGRIALATWAPQSTVVKMFEVMKRYMPAPNGPAPRSPFEWGRPERVRELFESRFQLRFEQGVSYYREPSGEAAWDTFSKGYGPTKALAASLDPERRRSLRHDFTAFHDRFPTELGICVPREYLVAIGVRV